MSILQTFLDVSQVSFSLTVLIQLAVASLIGFIVLKAASRRSAPLRSLVAVSVMILLALTLIVSVGFRLSNVSWCKAEPLSITPGTVTVMPEPATSNRNTFAEISSSQADTEKFNIATQASSQRYNISREQVFTVLGIVWLSGVFVMILKLCYGLIFMRGFKYGLTPVSNTHLDKLMRVVAAKFNKNRPPSLYTSTKVETPITTGIANPIVIIPEEVLDKLSDSEMKSILLHELAHIYSCDHLIGIFKRIVIAANWWNPLVYIISAEHSAVREEIADNHVLLELHPKIYAECLVGLAEKVCLINKLPATAGMAGKTSGLEQRIKNILTKNRKLTMKIGKKVKGMTYGMICFTAIFIGGVQYSHADNSAETKVDKHNLTKLALKGGKLSSEEAERLEKKVSENPNDLNAVTELLGYYFGKDIKNKKIRDKKEKIVLQLIQNHPECSVLAVSFGQFYPIIYDCKQAAKLWQTQVAKHPDNLKILWNAASWSLVVDRALSKQYLKKGQSLDPGNPMWSQKLGLLYSLPGTANMKASLQEYKKAYNETKTKNVNVMLPALAKAALGSDKFDDAEKYAQKMLAQAKEIGKKNWNYGNLIYYGNYTLGMIALKKGNIDDACKYLLKAGNTPGSPQLNSFGPDLTLAKNLLEKGKKECVMEFLKSCSRFWKRNRCDNWIKQIKAGDNPDWVIINGQLLPINKRRKPITLENEHAVELLIQALKDKDSNVREAAARKLGYSRDKRAVEPLIKALKDENSGVREAAARTLGSLRDKRAVESLIQVLKDKDIKVRQAATIGLCFLKDKRAVEPIAKLLKDDNNSFDRAIVVMSLAEFGDKRAFEPAIELLKDNNSSITTRSAAIISLTKLDDKRIIGPLKEQLKTQQDPRVIKAIKKALEKLESGN